MLNPRLLERLVYKKNQLDAMRPLPVLAVQRLKEQLTIEWVYNSNAIEGSTLTLRETQLILETGLTIGGKGLREHLEVINHKDAIDYIERLVLQPERITPFNVRQIHKLVLARIDDENAGQYRHTQVRVAGASYSPPDAWEIPQRMTDWEIWLQANDAQVHPVALAALAHHRLVAIHPFVDGNGRTGRLVMNLILMRHGYPPTVIFRANRRQYYRVLMQADAERPEPLINFVGRAMEHSLNLYLEACTSRILPYTPQEEWLSLAQAAEGTPYSQEYLSLLARKGQIDAVKRGSVWYTSRQAIAAYQLSVKQKKTLSK